MDFEPYANGLLELVDRPNFVRFSRAQRRWWEQILLPPYHGEALYPCGLKWEGDFCVFPDYSYTAVADMGKLRERFPAQADELEALLSLPFPQTPHTVGGNGYTHSMPNYERVAKEGLNAYETRVRGMQDETLREGLLDLLCGIRAYHERCLSLLRASGNAPAELLTALEQVPFRPARTIYEALVCRNFIYYIDGCDNPGRLDTELYPYWQGEDITDLLRAFFRNVDANSGWSSALGPDYNPITIQCLNACHGMRRPSLELRVTPEMPADVWEAAAAAIAAGGGSPSLYNEPAYQQALAERFPEIPACDLQRFNGGGCTETMLAGISNVGSLDLGINTALILGDFLREALPDAPDFDTLVERYLERLYAETADALDKINHFRRVRAEKRPQPIRTLLIDDCIAREQDFNAGGARYYWSVINFAGVVNVIDSFLAVKALVYDSGRYDAATFLRRLDDPEDQAFAGELRKAPCFGVDDDAADGFAASLTARIFDSLSQRTPYLGGRFLPSSIQFVTYVDAGRAVPATPDGRAAGAPLADSLGAIHGKDRKGPTALLRSVAKLPLREAAGTPVLNLRMQKKYVQAQLRPLMEGFFAQGGMQAQITCLSREDMLAAIEHPEQHQNLVVRVGGYSEYFVRLDRALQETLLARTEFGEE